MADLLVKLYTLPPLEPLLARQAERDTVIRRALAPERDLVLDWVARSFEYGGWRSEVAVCFARDPMSCLVAVRAGRLVGFACYDAIYRGFFGPTGVAESERGGGIGQALLVATLHMMATVGYAYAMIGDVGPSAFYERSVGAMLIDGSHPGPYAGLLAGEQ